MRHLLLAIIGVSAITSESIGQVTSSFGSSSIFPVIHFDTAAEWSFRPFLVETSLAGNHGLLSYSKLFSSDLRSKILPDSEWSSGWAAVNIGGPSFSYKADNRTTFSISSDFRTIINFSKVDGRLAGEINESQKAHHNYPFELDPSQTTRINAAGFSSISFNASRALVIAPTYRFDAAIGVKYLSGTTHFSLLTDRLSGTVDLNDNRTASYMNNSTGIISLRSSGKFFDDVSIGSLLSPSRATLGFDLGLSYTIFGKKDGPPKFKVHVAVLDIGRLKFSADSASSKSYSVDIKNVRGKGLYFNENFNNLSISKVAKVFDNHPEFFKLKEKTTGHYSVAMPTVAFIQSEYNFLNSFGVLGSASIPLQKSEDNASIYVPYKLKVAPIFRHGSSTFTLPITVQEYSGTSVGLSYHSRYIFITSESVLSGFGNSKYLNFNAGLVFVAGKKGFLPYRQKQLLVMEPVFGTDSLARQFIYSLDLLAVTTSSSAVPFWFRANKFGSVPNSGTSVSVIPSVKKDYSAIRSGKFIDWGTSLEARLNVGKETRLILTEAYAKVRLGIFETKVGRSKDIVGLIADSTLSLGAFAQSGNALGIPKIEVSIPNYIRLPFLNGLISFKGNYAHGWLGTYKLQGSSDSPVVSPEASTFFHQKSLYLRLGKDSWRPKFYGGLSHNAFWSDTRKIYGSKSRLSMLDTYWYIVSGKRYGEGLGIEVSKLGNHAGSIDMGFEYRFNSFNLKIMRQNFYDVGALSKLANIRDGLNGILIENTRTERKAIVMKKLLLEYFHSVDQAGQLWSKPTKSGDEDYYNNYLYPSGWSYGGVAIGNPIITTKTDARSNLRSKSGEFFINNRVSAFHLAFISQILGCEVVTKATYSLNYGTYGTSSIGSTLGKRRYIIDPPYFNQVNQFSGFLEVSKFLANNLRISAAISGDTGKLLRNSGGAYIRVSYQW